MSIPNREQLLAANAAALALAGLQPVSSGTHLERVAAAASDPHVAGQAKALIAAPPANDPWVYETPTVVTPTLEQQSWEERRKNAVRLEEPKTAYDE